MASPASAAPSSAVAAPPLSPPSPPGDEALDPDPEPDPSSAAPAPAAMAPAAPAPAATAPAAPATAATATAPAPAAPADRGTEQAAPAADAGVVAAPAPPATTPPATAPPATVPPASAPAAPAPAATADLAPAAWAPAALDPAAPAPATEAPAAPDAAPPLPPPPDKLPAGFTPTVVPGDSMATVEQAWVEVGARRRPRPEKVAAPPPRKEAGLPRAFKQRTFGLCFRCLASDHFVAGCRGSIRCLGCGVSGHLERDCKAPHPAGSGPPHCPRTPAEPCQRPIPSSGASPAQPLRPCRSWASVVAQPGGSAADGDVSAAGSGGPPAVLGSVEPLLAAQAEVITAELQAMFAARLEVLFKPLQDLVAAAVASQEVPPDEVMKSAFVEEATMLRSMLPEMVSSQLGELIEPVRVMSQSLQGLLEQLGSMMQRAVVALEEPALATTCVQASSSQLVLAVSPSAPPPQAVTYASFQDWPFDLHDVPLVQVNPKQLESVVEPGVTVAFEEVVAVPSLEGNPVRDLGQDDVPVQESPDRVAPSPLEEFLKELEAPPSHFERRSCRLDLKHKGCVIPVSKHAEFRRAEAFGEVPNA